MGHDQDGLAAPPELADLVQALPREGLVADGEDLVDEEDVGVDVDRHGKPEPRVHARRVGLDRRVDEALHLREGHDVVEALLDLAPGEAEHDPVDRHVLAAADLGMEAGSQLDQGGHAALHREAATGRLRYAGEELQECGLPRAVLADDAEGGALLHLEGDAV